MNKHHHYRLRLLLFTILLFIVSLVCFYMESNAEVEAPKVKVITPVQDTDVVRVITINKEVVETDDNEYLLAKIAMAEAEGESIEGKALVMQVILNRAQSPLFPNTIKEVIFEERGGTYQFSPLFDGRFYKVEPNDDCWEALKLVQDGECKTDALYFTSSKEQSNWHSRNLEFLFQVGNHKFYK